MSGRIRWKQPVSEQTKLSSSVVLAFACVYFFWGSTYVAIRFGVEVIPPFVLAAVRYLVAGPLMLALCAARGLKLRQCARDYALLAAIGILMLGFGNAALVWCEQFLSSGLSALLLAVIPIYVALFEVFLPSGESLRAKGWFGIVIGFAGLIILVWPGLLQSFHGSRTQLIATAIALIGAFAWTCGSILSRRARLTTVAFVAAAWEMLFAGLFNAGVMLASRSYHNVNWNSQSILAIAWLVTFGSIVGYTAYIYLLDTVPVAKVSTYAYVNPIVAVALGAIFLHERMVPIEYAGMAAILTAVYLVTSSKLRSESTVVQIECTPAEQEA